METERREEKKSCPGTPLSSRDPELYNQLLFLRPHGSKKVHYRRKQLSWRPAASRRRGRARWPALDGAGW